MAYLDENGLEHFWGKIKDHVDSAVAPKADDADVLHKNGTEAVSGEKVFSGSQTTAAGNASALIVVKDPDLVKGETPATNHFLSLGFIDSTGDSYAQDIASRLAVVEYKSPSEADPESYMQMVDGGFNGGGMALLQVGHDKDNIRYATAPATSDDRTNSTDIVTRGYMEASEWNWQKTEKAVSVAFKPVPESDLEPVVDFMFTETPPAEGEKGPENPSTITGVSQTKVTRCGKNLCPIDKISMDWSVTGLTVSANTNDGYIGISGTATTSASVASIYLRYVSGKNSVFAANGILRGETYTFSLSGDAPSSVSLNLFVKSTAAAGWVNRVNVTSGHSQTYTIPETAYDAILRLDVTSGSVVDCKCYVQVEKGSTATSFEPYSGTDYIIQLGDTYYGGSLDVATGVMTVTWAGVVFTGEEKNTWFSQGQTPSGINRYSATLANNALLKTSLYSQHCTHFPYAGNWDSSSQTFYAANNYINFFSIKPTLEDFKAFVASQYASGTPVISTYMLTNPKTVQLTPTQIRSLPALDKYEPRINTVYTDQEAVQVGYQRYVGDKFRKNVVIENTNPTLYLDGFVDSVRDDIQFRVENQQGVKKVLAAIRLVPTGSLMIGRASDPAGYWYDGAHISMFKTGGMSLYVRNNDGSNSHTLGLDLSGSLLWDGQEVQITSDERRKTSLTAIPDAVLDAWEAVQWGQFKFLDAVAEKGEEAARLHLGLIAQRVKAVFEAQGLDACQYGILCHEEHEATDEKPAVDLWMIRYAEAQAMEACCMRRENARLKKRVADLEERLAALELKIS